MAEPHTSSRLQLLQARFQQKQLQEKEQKLLQLYDQQQQRAHQVAQRGSAGSNGSNGSNGSSASGIANPPGKIRQMFDERRQGNAKGIDKSYPLDPLNGRSKKRASAGTVKNPAKPGNAVNSRRNIGVSRTNTNATTSTSTSAGADANGTANRAAVASSRGHRKDSIIQRESITRESYDSSRGDYSEPSESEPAVGQLNGHARNEQRYEINIDEVIDNEAMERNRLLAKFHAVDVDKRRRFEADEFPEEVARDAPDKAAPRQESQQPEARAERLKNTNATRKSNSVTGATATKKRAEPTTPMGANARQSSVMRTTKSASLKIRKKLPRNIKALEDRRKWSSLRKSNQGKSKKENITLKTEGCHHETSTATDWNTLKSTSLIFEMIRNHSKYGHVSDIDKIGKVRKMVIKIENTSTEVETEIKTAIDISSSSNINAESAEASLPERSEKPNLNAPLPSTSRKRPSILDSDLCKANAAKTIIKVSSNATQETLLKNIESEDQGDGLIQREEISILAIRGNRESSVEHPTEQQEITVADQTIKVEKRMETDDRLRDNLRKLSFGEGANRVRRASFELKRMMFEQIQDRQNFQRHDSVESALRHFDSIGIDATDSSEPLLITTGDSRRDKILESEESNADAASNLMNDGCDKKGSDEQRTVSRESNHSTFRLCTKDAIKTNAESLGQQHRAMKGFEKHTSAWSIRTLKERAPWYPETPTKVRETAATPTSNKRVFTRRKAASKVKKGSSKKLLEARDSIELARVPIKTKLPACRRKILLNSNASLPAEKTQIQQVTSQVENDEATPVKSQSLPHDNRVTQLKRIFSNESIPKNKTFSTSTTRNSNADSSSKKVDSSPKSSDSIVRKNVSPYPSSKSPDNVSEQKSRPLAKPTSLKFLSRIDGSNGDMATSGENGFSTAARKSSVPAVDSLDPAANSRNTSFDDEKPSAFAAVAPRTTSSLSSNSSVGTARSHGSTDSRPVGKAKPGATGPTPALRSSAQSKSTPVNDDSLSTCNICNRRFATNRIGLHEQICTKTSQKKRKQFDAVTHRAKGTELEPFVQKPHKKQGKAAAAKPAAEPSTSNWRRKHEDFINAIRSAKQMQAHLAAGGKLSDLPPPPPSDTSDYIQCPHCSRKFNQGAAERHIPKCETMQHNKPRAPLKIKR